jgi:hypothetical protein
MSLQLFFHSIASDCFTHEVTAFKENGVYTVVNVCHDTGRTHMRFFEDLRELVLWHYADQDYTILDKDYPFEREVKVLFNPPTDEEIYAAIGYTPPSPAPKPKPSLPSTKWDTPRRTQDTILWTV